MPLGRGLNSLLPQKPITTNFSNKAISEIDQKNQILDVELDKIQVNPHQPRKRFDHADLEDLINSIKVYGIIQPLIVTRQDDDKFQLIAGERRLRSAQILNLKTVPVIVRDAKEQQKLEIALIENVQRKNLNPLEEALSYKRLMDEFSLTQDDVAQKIGKKRSTVANTMRLLALPEEVQKAILDEKISEGHARAIASLTDEKAQKEFLQRILRDQMSVRQAEGQVREVKVKGQRRAFEKNPIIAEKESQLQEYLGHRVTIKSKGKGGEITFYYGTQEDFNDLYKKILNLE